MTLIILFSMRFLVPEAVVTLDTLLVARLEMDWAGKRDTSNIMYSAVAIRLGGSDHFSLGNNMKRTH